MKETDETVAALREAVAELVAEVRELKAANGRLEARLARIDRNAAGSARAVAGLKPALERIGRKLARNATQANISLKVLKDGEMAETPVTELTAGKRRQVEAYVACRKANPGISMCRALELSFREEPNGFAFGGLKSFVWRNSGLLG